MEDTKKIQLSRLSGTIPTGNPKSGSGPFISEKQARADLCQARSKFKLFWPLLNPCLL